MTFTQSFVVVVMLPILLHWWQSYTHILYVASLFQWVGRMIASETFLKDMGKTAQYLF